MSQLEPRVMEIQLLLRSISTNTKFKSSRISFNYSYSLKLIAVESTVTDLVTGLVFFKKINKNYTRNQGSKFAMRIRNSANLCEAKANSLRITLFFGFTKLLQAKKIFAFFRNF